MLSPLAAAAAEPMASFQAATQASNSVTTTANAAADASFVTHDRNEVGAGRGGPRGDVANDGNEVQSTLSPASLRPSTTGAAAGGAGAASEVEDRSAPLGRGLALSSLRFAPTALSASPSVQRLPVTEISRRKSGRPQPDG